jgi:hypothetical protein
MLETMIRLQDTMSVAEILHRLLNLLCRGLPSYAVEINPWMQPDQEPLRRTLADLAADRRLYANRAAQAISQRGEHPDPGPFPLKYTGLNDVSLEYLAREVLDSLQVDIEVLREFSAQLAGNPDLHALAQEILGNTIGHAEILEKMMRGEGRGTRGEGRGTRGEG